MKILQLCLRVPFPLLDGGNIAMFQVAKALLESGHTVHLLALNTQKHKVDAVSEESYFRRYLDRYANRCRLETVPIDTTVKPGPALWHLLSRTSYNVSRFFSKAFAKRLAETLQAESYDIVQLESLFMTPYLETIRRNSKARLVMRAHNVEHVIWQRLASAEKSFLKKTYLQLLVRSLRRYEVQSLQELDALLPITPDDAAIFRQCGFRGPMEVIPVSLEGSNEPVDANLFRRPSLFHLGSMEWMPNVEGIRWFLDSCWPAIHVAHPELPLFLAGRGFPADIASLNLPKVTCAGEIADAAAYMQDKPLMIVPLLSGSGMRVKIIQGMAAGRVVISTRIGAEGIACTNRKDILIADTPEDFFDAVTYAVQHPEEMVKISMAAQKLIEEKYSAASVGKKLDHFYNSLVNENRSS